MTLHAAMQALRQDSAAWEQTALATGKAGDEAATLHLSATELSWASLPTGLLDTYTQLQTKVVRLLGEASSVYTDLALALDQIAYAYEINDQQAARRFEGVWDLRD